MITGFFLICYSPYIFTQVLQGTLLNSNYIGKIHAVTLSLILLNSVINPVLYVWRFTEARYQLKLFFYFWNKEKMEEINQERNSVFATYSIPCIKWQTRKAVLPLFIIQYNLFSPFSFIWFHETKMYFGIVEDMESFF